jgi:hypothetical protein
LLPTLSRLTPAPADRRGGSDTTSRTPRSRTQGNIYHDATTPKLTYLSETNSLVICDFDVGAEHR